MAKGERKNQQQQGQKVKSPLQARSRKGYMRGKGGPENTSCTYKGVRQRTWGKWVSEIREPNRGARLWLGTYGSSREAAIAYDAAARRLYGARAKVNLPDEVVTDPQQMEYQIQTVKDIDAQMQISHNLGSQIQTQPENYDLTSSMVIDIDDFVNRITISPIEPSTYIGEGDQYHCQIVNNNYHDGRFSETTFMTTINQCDWGNLSINLPEFDNSSIWTEAVATMDFHIVNIDPGILATNYDDEIGIGIQPIGYQQGTDLLWAEHDNTKNPFQR